MRGSILIIKLNEKEKILHEGAFVKLKASITQLDLDDFSILEAIEDYEGAILKITSMRDTPSNVICVCKSGKIGHGWMYQYDMLEKYKGDVL